jgi:hypothetical protein
MVSTISTIPNLCSNHSIDPYHGQLTSRRMGDHNSHTKTQAILNTSQTMEDLYDTQDCKSKQIYPDTNLNPKDINVGIQFKK